MCTVIEFKTIIGLTISDLKIWENTVTFTTICGTRLKMLHVQDCCEVVKLLGVIGDINDLIGSPVLTAELVIGELSDVDDQVWKTQTWSFIKMATLKGHVDFRWHGTSNGDCSETAEILRIK